MHYSTLAEYITLHLLKAVALNGNRREKNDKGLRHHAFCNLHRDFNSRRHLQADLANACVHVGALIPHICGTPAHCCVCTCIHIHMGMDSGINIV